ncbi:gluconokinase [Pedobacter nyackensis]|uniref:gluconokinase n=1 Tax=Pedobacter nyackensis TaxID=475255 RepID=UPI00292E04D8|nr:gluconokinase [Pedobacter nyackensis]
MKYYIGADIGTGSVKILAVDLKGTVLKVIQKHYPVLSPHPGYSEQDPEEIWQAFSEGIHEIILACVAAPISVGLSSAMHSLILCNASGSALAPMITWADARSSAIAASLKETETGKGLYRRTGTPLHAMSPLCKLIWLKEHEPGLFRKASKYVSIKEYIWFKLFGVWEIDHSIASCTGLFNILTRDWDPEALLLAGISTEKLSVPVPTTHIRKIAAEPLSNKHPLSENTTEWVIGASDGCLANLGTGAIKTGIAAITIGTSGAVRVTGKSPVFNNDVMTFNYILDDVYFVSGGSINNGGLAIQWMIRNIMGLEDDQVSYQSFFDLAAGIPAGSEGLIFLPYLTGERAPVWDADSSGMFFGLKTHHTKAHLCRAVIEGICFALQEVLAGMDQSYQDISEIRVSGGFTKSATWTQILADVTGKKVALVQNDDASAIGAAMLAIRTIIGAVDYLYPEQTNLNYFPQQDTHLRYQAFSNIYKSLYTNLKTQMHALHQLSVNP